MKRGLRENRPYLAVASILSLSFSLTLLIQAVGQYVNVSLLAVSLPTSIATSVFLTYRYFFIFDKKHLTAACIVAATLGISGLLSARLYDLTSDGMGYQQPEAEAILAGWNPLHHDAKLLWANIYPSGAGELEASLSQLYGSIEATKVLPLWWLLIASILLLSGLGHCRGRKLTKQEGLLALLILFSPIVITQLLTHYVDAMVYLSGIAFLGSMLLYGGNRQRNLLSLLLMAGNVLFIVNAKLSGLFHAAVLCFCALLYIGLNERRLPLRETLFLFCAGICATIFLGFHPYVTNIMTYGSLLHMDGAKFSSYQRPSNLGDLSPPLRFLYSFFSPTGGAPRAETFLKFPWIIGPREWAEAGSPDSRTGGFGVWFALASLLTFGYLVLARLLGKTDIDKPLLSVAAVLLISSMVFPEGWWARYVPFAYAGVLLMLLAIAPSTDSPLKRYGMPTILLVLSVNCLIALYGTVQYVQRAQDGFYAMAAELRTKPTGSVYLVPPAEDYDVYNASHLSLQRRLKHLGVETTIKVNGPCPQMARALSEFKICY